MSEYEKLLKENPKLGCKKDLVIAICKEMKFLRAASLIGPLHCSRCSMKVVLSAFHTDEEREEFLKEYIKRFNEEEIAL